MFEEPVVTFFVPCFVADIGVPFAEVEGAFSCEVVSRERGGSSTFFIGFDLDTLFGFAESLSTERRRAGHGDVCGVHGDKWFVREREARLVFHRSSFIHTGLSVSCGSRAAYSGG